MPATSLRLTRARVLGACAAAAVIAPLALATPAFAGSQMQNPVTGSVSCNPETGQNEITWTLTNNVGQTIFIEGTTLSGALTGPAVSWLTDEVPESSSTTAQTLAPIGTTGAVVISVETEWNEGDSFTLSTFTVNLGSCQQVTTTTTSTTSTSTTSTTSTTAPTSSTTSTTTPPAAVVAVVATPRFTG